MQVALRVRTGAKPPPNDRHEGLYGFYRGLVPGTVRVLPATCITFVVYEEMSHLFRTHAR
jgi:hypothetical protein